MLHNIMIIATDECLGLGTMSCSPQWVLGVGLRSVSR